MAIQYQMAGILLICYHFLERSVKNRIAGLLSSLTDKGPTPMMTEEKANG
jgi:hypothetical protein